MTYTANDIRKMQLECRLARLMSRQKENRGVCNKIRRQLRHL